MLLLALLSGSEAICRAGDLRPLKVVTWNIMWEEAGVRAGNLKLPVWADRADLVTRWILELEPDVVGLQEASPEQQRDLEKHLPGFGLVYDRLANNTNPILYRKARLERVDAGSFVMNHVPEQTGTNIGLRTASWVRLMDKESQQLIGVWNVHLDHRGNGSTRQQCVVRLAEAMQKTGAPVILTGDFNCRLPQPAMRFLLGDVALPNDQGAEIRSPVPLGDAMAIYPDPANLIDRILVSRGIQAARTRQRRDMPHLASDHYPVEAEIHWAEVEAPVPAP